MEVIGYSVKIFAKIQKEELGMSQISSIIHFIQFFIERIQTFKNIILKDSEKNNSLMMDKFLKELLRNILKESLNFFNTNDEQLKKDFSINLLQCLTFFSNEFLDVFSELLSSDCQNINFSIDYLKINELKEIV